MGNRPTSSSVAAQTERGRANCPPPPPRDSPGRFGSRCNCLRIKDDVHPTKPAACTNRGAAATATPAPGTRNCPVCDAPRMADRVKTGHGEPVADAKQPVADSRTGDRQVRKATRVAESPRANTCKRRELSKSCCQSTLRHSLAGGQMPVIPGSPTAALICRNIMLDEDFRSRRWVAGRQNWRRGRTRFGLDLE